MTTHLTIRTTRAEGFGQSHSIEKHILDEPLTVSRLTGYLDLMDQASKIDSITITEAN
jgi:hypothetical protein